MTVRVMWHPSSMEHDTGAGHPESPDRLRAILDEFRKGEHAALLMMEESEPATLVAIARTHPDEHVTELRDRADAGGGRIDQDTVMSVGSWNAARYAAGAAITAAQHAMNGSPSFAAVRPPGHHATANTAMGFCLLNNVVIAARELLARRSVGRVLIVDWDVHHGNGTQDLVERDARIRYVSLHQWPLYPGTGRAEERGVGNIFNVPRPPGLSRHQYVDDLDEAVRAATADWTPDVMLISAGFDALSGDPLAGFTLEPEDYAEWVDRWRRYGVPTAAVLEGGYVPERIAQAALSTVRAMSVG